MKYIFVVISLFFMSSIFAYHIPDGSPVHLVGNGTITYQINRSDLTGNYQSGNRINCQIKTKIEGAVVKMILEFNAEYRPAWASWPMNTIRYPMNLLPLTLYEGDQAQYGSDPEIISFIFTKLDKWPPVDLTMTCVPTTK